MSRKSNPFGANRGSTIKICDGFKAQTQTAIENDHVIRRSNVALADRILRTKLNDEIHRTRGKFHHDPKSDSWRITFPDGSVYFPAGNAFALLYKQALTVSLNRARGAA